MKIKIAKIVKCVISSRRMIIKATLITLVVILVVVIVTSYYVNKEGFDDITNSLGSAINTVTPDAASLLANLPPTSRDALLSAASQLNATPSVASTITASPTASTAATPSVASALSTRSAAASPTASTAATPSVASTAAASPAASTAATPSTAASPAVSTAAAPSVASTAARPSAIVPPTPVCSPSPPLVTTGSSIPTRTDVVPQVSFSENGYNALMLQQKADLLKDIQKVVRNEVLANRSTTPMLHNDGYGCGSEDEHKSECEPVKDHGCNNEDVPKNECGEKSVKDKVTAAISQGKEYENSCYKDKTARASCPPQPDMAQFIKKDAIPCWGCSLDY
jgi:hypothetical protein